VYSIAQYTNILPPKEGKIKIQITENLLHEISTKSAEEFI
jgi:hypothetical protein